MGSLVTLNPSTNVLVSITDFTKEYVEEFLGVPISLKKYMYQHKILKELHVHKTKNITHFTNNGRPCLFGFSMCSRHKNCSIETYRNRWSSLGKDLSPSSKDPVSCIWEIFNSLSIGVDKNMGYKKREKSVRTRNKKRLDNDTYVYIPGRKSQKHRNMVQGRTKEAREIVQEGHTVMKEDGHTIKTEDGQDEEGDTVKKEDDEDDEDEQMLHQDMKVDKEMNDLYEMEDDLTDDNLLQDEQDIQNDLQDMPNINWKKMEDVDEQDIQNDLLNNMNWTDMDDIQEKKMEDREDDEEEDVVVEDQENLLYNDVEEVEDQEDLLYDDVEEDHDTDVQHEHDFLSDLTDG